MDDRELIRKAQERGDFVTGDDGFVIYWPDRTGGFSSHMLRVLADELDKRNEWLKNELEEYFDGR